MLYITKQIGNQYFVYDTDDGTIEFVPSDAVLSYYSQEKSKGVNANIAFANSPLIISADGCNWLPNKVNIWSCVESVICRSPREGKYVIKSAGKQFKVTYLRDKGLLAFTNGILVSIDERISSLFQ